MAQVIAELWWHAASGTTTIFPVKEPGGVWLTDPVLLPMTRRRLLILYRQARAVCGGSIAKVYGRDQLLLKRN